MKTITLPGIDPFDIPEGLPQDQEMELINSHPAVQAYAKHFNELDREDAIAEQKQHQKQSESDALDKTNVMHRLNTYIENSPKILNPLLAAHQAIQGGIPVLGQALPDIQSETKGNLSQKFTEDHKYATAGAHLGGGALAFGAIGELATARAFGKTAGPTTEQALAAIRGDVASHRTLDVATSPTKELAERAFANSEVGKLAESASNSKIWPQIGNEQAKLFAGVNVADTVARNAKEGGLEGALATTPQEMLTAIALGAGAGKGSALIGQAISPGRINLGAQRDFANSMTEAGVKQLEDQGININDPSTLSHIASVLGKSPAEVKDAYTQVIKNRANEHANFISQRGAKNLQDIKDSPMGDKEKHLGSLLSSAAAYFAGGTESAILNAILWDHVAPVVKNAIPSWKVNQIMTKPGRQELLSAIAASGAQAATRQKIEIAKANKKNQEQQDDILQGP